MGLGWISQKTPQVTQNLEFYFFFAADYCRFFCALFHGFYRSDSAKYFKDHCIFAYNHFSGKYSGQLQLPKRKRTKSDDYFEYLSFMQLFGGCRVFVGVI